MDFDEVIRLKSLTFKASLTGGVTDNFDLMPDDEQKSYLRNICAMIDRKLFDDVEGITSLLGLSKRQFVEMALIEAVKKAEAVMDEVNIYNYQEGDV